MKNTTPHATANASYEKNILTLDLPRANQPMLWRQEIRNISNVVFMVAAQDSGDHALVMKISNGNEQIIARFAEVANAEEALAAIRKIFMNYKKKRGFWGILFRLLFLIFLIGVINATFHLADVLATAGAFQHAAVADTSTLSATPAPTTPNPTPPAAAGH